MALAIWLKPPKREISKFPERESTCSHGYLLRLPRVPEVGPLKLATMSFKDTAAIAKQLAFEMNIPYESYFDETVETWLQGAEKERDLLKELEGCMAQTWRLLQPSGSSSSATEVAIPKPDSGERPTRVRGPSME